MKNTTTTETAIATIARERDEARAELADAMRRLAVNSDWRQDQFWQCRTREGAELRRTLEARAERDEARAELAALRAELASANADRAELSRCVTELRGQLHDARQARDDVQYTVATSSHTWRVSAAACDAATLELQARDWREAVYLSPTCRVRSGRGTSLVVERLTPRGAWRRA